MKGTVSIVGAGRVGRTLGRRLRERGWRIGAVVTRRPGTARAAVAAIGAGSPMIFSGGKGLYLRARRRKASRKLPLDLDAVFAADVVFLTTSDDVLPAIARALARHAGAKCRGKIILHTAATLDRTALLPFARLGAAVGSLHPMQAFGANVMPQLGRVIFAIEGDPRARRTAQSIAKSLGGIPVTVRTQDKPIYHASAVLAAGSMYPTMEAGLELLTRIGFTRRRAEQTLFPLIRQILDNIERLGPRAAWTGPLSRGDYAIVARHMRALRKHPREIQEAYAALAILAGRVLAKDPAATLKKIHQVLGESR